jgi:hypothetical protein
MFLGAVKTVNLLKIQAKTRDNISDKETTSIEKYKTHMKVKMIT